MYVPCKGDARGFDFVPDKETALSIGLAVLTPIYGEKQIQMEMPFRADLHKDVWTVYGSLPEGHFGGVAIVEIDMHRGTILRVYHGE
jgi:hypothetical protein